MLQEQAKSHVVQMIENGFLTAKTIGKSLLLLDRYFLSVSALETLNNINNNNCNLMQIVTKAKQSCIAYEKPEEYIGRGRPRKKGASIKLKDCFQSKKDYFTKVKVMIYGREQEVSELKQVIGAFNYQFWSKSMPKLKRFKKKTEVDAIDEIEDSKVKERIINTLNAIEMYVMCSCISIGLLQIIALKFSATDLKKQNFRYLRTISKEVVSEATVASYLRKNIFRIMAKNEGLSITKIIKKKQLDPSFYEELKAS